MQCSLAMSVNILEGISNTSSVTDLVVTVLVNDTLMPVMKSWSHYGKIV